MPHVYSEKQQQLLSLLVEEKLQRINLLEGSVRSGKTWISLVVWAFWVALSPVDGAYLMAAKTLTTLKRNCLDPLEKLVGVDNFTYSLSKKEGRLFGRLIYLEGADDVRSENKIRGTTLWGAYCDELTLIDESFFTMLLSRLSMPGAKAFATTNPDNPSHWLKRRFIDRRQTDDLDMLILRFTLDDNFALDPVYVQNLKKEYSGVFYDRYILGLWKTAQGLVYPSFSRDRHVINEGLDGAGGKRLGKDVRYYVSIDYGTANPCSMGVWGLGRDRAVRIREFYHDSRKAMKQLTDEQYYAELVRLVGDLPIHYIIVDPSAASFIATVRHHGKFSVRKAKNSVIDGIRLMSSLLDSGFLMFDKSCVDIIREFGEYCWDEDAGEDKVIKAFDHAMDDARYFCSTVVKRMR